MNDVGRDALIPPWGFCKILNGGLKENRPTLASSQPGTDQCGHRSLQVFYQFLQKKEPQTAVLNF